MSLSLWTLQSNLVLSTHILLLVDAVGKVPLRFKASFIGGTLMVVSWWGELRDSLDHFASTSISLILNGFSVISNQVIVGPRSIMSAEQLWMKERRRILVKVEELCLL